MAYATKDDHGLPVPMTKKLQDVAVKLGDRLLRDVGIEPTRVDRSQRVVHVRRSLSNAEVAKLPAAWRAIEPVDLGGNSGFLDEIARRLR